MISKTYEKQEERKGAIARNRKFHNKKYALWSFFFDWKTGFRSAKTRILFAEIFLTMLMLFCYYCFVFFKITFLRRCLSSPETANKTKWVLAYFGIYLFVLKAQAMTVIISESFLTLKTFFCDHFVLIQQIFN